MYKPFQKNRPILLWQKSFEKNEKKCLTKGKRCDIIIESAAKRQARTILEN